MRTLFSAPGLVTIEHDLVKKRFVTRWTKYHGPHFRDAINAMLSEVKKSGVTAYISDASLAKDVPAQADLQWVETTVKAELVKGGLKKFITVVPASSIAKMATQRFGKVAVTAGVENFQVGSLADANSAADGTLKLAA